jgi:Zn-dependent peptidase ImmA (M78 family)
MNIKETAWEFIRENDIKSFRITVDAILKMIHSHNDWNVFSYHAGEPLIERLNLKNYTKTSKAFTCLLDSSPTKEPVQFLIFYRDELPYNEKVFVLLHEIGHILLYHTYAGAVLGKNRSSSITNEQEREADLFACEVMAPSCILKDRFRIDTADRIAEISMLPPEYALLHAGEIHRTAQMSVSYSLLESIYGQYQGFVRQVKKSLFLDHLHKVSRPVSALTFVLILTVITTLIFYSNPEKDSVSNSDMTKNQIHSDYVSAKASESVSPEEDMTVYVTKSGEKYHFSGCRYLKKSSPFISMTITEAIQNGYTPCEICGSK